MWEKLKNILAGTDKAIIIEDGEPRYVLLSVGEYLRLCTPIGAGTTDSPDNFLTPKEPPPPNTGIPATDTNSANDAPFMDSSQNPMHASVNAELSSVLGSELSGSGEISLDDLPF